LSARTEADHNAARRGTVQHEVLEGTAAAAFTADSIDAGKVDAPIRTASRSVSRLVEVGWGHSLLRFTSAGTSTLSMTWMTPFEA
jgi:hypothetical protein